MFGRRDDQWRREREAADAVFRQAEKCCFVVHTEPDHQRYYGWCVIHNRPYVCLWIAPDATWRVKLDLAPAELSADARTLRRCDRLSRRYGTGWSHAINGSTITILVRQAEEGPELAWRVWEIARDLQIAAETAIV